jgi:hypothetical protein
MCIPKLKIIKILSNGSLDFCYKTCNNFKLINILEKDSKNFHFNLKLSKNTLITQKKNSEYKNKYFNLK